MTDSAAPCYTRFDGKPLTVRGYAVVSLPGRRLEILAVVYISHFKYQGFPGCDPAAERVTVDKDYVFRTFQNKGAAHRAFEAAQGHWMVDRSLAIDAIRREPDA